ncbi:hypothetical protein [uncultured Sneathia sp.]|uniref:hypothetical protein n=1 Tax=uncultured Sneathia sp. TaxID=278067 RepID=UPI002593AFBF|nr:hypothetical protein [uncultured Sneathia sp.]
MKKTILLASLVASITTLAATEGHVNYTFKGEINSKYANQQTANEFKVPETFVETEVKVKGSGLSFGGEFKAKDIKLGEDNKAHFLNHSKVFAKYELPEIKGVKSFVKATAEPKFIGDDKGSAELEGQVSYKYGEFTFGLNSKTNFPFAKKAATYGEDVKSTHKVFVESEKDKDVFVKGLKDVKANVEIKHDYRKLAENHKAAEAVNYVKGEVSAKYDAIKDFAVEGKAGFKVNVSEFTNKKHPDFIKKDEGDNKHDVVLGGVKLNHYLDKFDSDWIREVTGLHREYANVKLTYTGVKGLTLSANPFVDFTEGYRKYDDSQKLVAGGYLLAYGTSLDAKYALLNNKLTLTGNSLLAGIKSVKKDSTTNPVTNSDYTIGVYTAKLGAKYDYAVDSKLTVSPELTVSSAILTNSGLNTLNGFVTLKPEVNAVYKATDKLELKGGVSLSANFDNIKKYNNKVESTKSLELKPSASLVYKPVEGLEVNNKVELPINFKEKSTADKSLEYKGLDVKTELNIKYSWK